MISRRRLLVAALAAPACAPFPGTSRAGLVDSFGQARAAGVPLPEPPYIAYYARRRRRLAFVAARHENGIASPTHAAVRQAFERVGPRAVIAEGFPTAWGESPERIVRDAGSGSSWGLGESAYAVRLAVALGTPFWGGEPTEREVNAALLAEGWSAEDILADMVLKMLPQTLRAGQLSGPDDPRFARLFEAWIEAARADVQSAPAFDRARFDDWYGRTFGVAFTSDPEFSNRHRPDRDVHFSRMVDRQGTLRDEHLLGVIRERLHAHGRVLVVYGASHHFTLWRALEADLGRPEIV